MWIKIKKFQRNMKKFGKVIKKKLKQLMEKIFKKIALSLMMTFQ